MTNQADRRSFVPAKEISQRVLIKEIGFKNSQHQEIGGRFASSVVAEITPAELDRTAACETHVTLEKYAKEVWETHLEIIAKRFIKQLKTKYWWNSGEHSFTEEDKEDIMDIIRQSVLLTMVRYRDRARKIGFTREWGQKSPPASLDKRRVAAKE
ncbi:MAG: hypothetical protein EXS55_04470 [Candidatus Magasanikbacteria bacterium]|nr:hypothetical protein [Candidatus Magasanikbacteria bacterium]